MRLCDILFNASELGREKQRGSGQLTRLFALFAACRNGQRDKFSTSYGLRVGSPGQCCCQCFIRQLPERRSCSLRQHGAGRVIDGINFESATAYFDPPCTRFYKQNNTPICPQSCSVLNGMYVQSLRWFSGKSTEMNDVSDWEFRPVFHSTRL